MKAALNGVTTAYVGNYYELTNSANKKYDYAGGARVALSDNGTLSWPLGDHLGSTAIAAIGTTGVLSSEQRYKPWGEQRYPSGASTLTTRHRFTGQIEDSYINFYEMGGRAGIPSAPARDAHNATGIARGCDSHTLVAFMSAVPEGDLPPRPSSGL